MNASSENGTDGHSVQNGRRVRHAKRSCVPCKRRKSRCDETLPDCAQCALRSDKCTWPAEGDKRKTRVLVPLLQSNIAALKATIDVLTSRIARFKRRAATGDTAFTPSPPASPVSSPIFGASGPVQAAAVAADWRQQWTSPEPGPVHLAHQSTVSVTSKSSFDGQESLNSPSASASLSASGGSHVRHHSLGNTGPSLLIQLPRQHGRSLSDNYLAAGAVVSSPPNHSPASATRSVPSPFLNLGNANQYLAVPGQDLAYRSNTPGASVFGSHNSFTDIDAGNVSDLDYNQSIVAPFGSVGKHLVTFDAGEDGMFLSGCSPLAFRASPSSPALSPTSSRSRTSSFNNSARPEISALQTRLDALMVPVTMTPISPTFAVDRHMHVQALQVPPALEHDVSCLCDWSRHLPAEIWAVLSREVHDAVLADYFKHLTPWQLRIVPKLFLRDMRIALSTPPVQKLSRTPHYSAGLHCAILADAGALADAGSPLSSRDLRDALARTARDLVEGECAQNVGTLASVMALAVLAQYHLAVPGRARLAFSINGMAIRAARSTGLNADASAFVEDEERADREWCYLSLFVQDVDMSLHVGQEATMPPPGFSFAAAPRYSSRDAPFVGEIFAQTYTLMVLASRAASAGLGSSNNLVQLQVDLNQWRDTLPSALLLQTGTDGTPGHLLVLHMAFHWVVIVLHIPFYTSPRARPESRKLVDNATAELFALLQMFQHLQPLQRAPLSLVQMIVVGGAAALMRVEVAHSHADCGFTDLAVDALRAMAYTFPLASVYADALSARIGALRSRRAPWTPDSLARPAAAEDNNANADPVTHHLPQASVPAVMVHTNTEDAVHVRSPVPTSAQLLGHQAFRMSSLYSRDSISITDDWIGSGCIDPRALLAPKAPPSESFTDYSLLDMPMSDVARHDERKRILSQGYLGAAFGFPASASESPAGGAQSHAGTRDY